MFKYDSVSKTRTLYHTHHGFSAGQRRTDTHRVTSGKSTARSSSQHSRNEGSTVSLVAFGALGCAWKPAGCATPGAGLTSFPENRQRSK